MSISISFALFFFIFISLDTCMKTFLDNSPFKQQDDYGKIQETMREQDFLTVIVYYKSTFCIKCAQGEPVLQKFAKKYEGVVNFYKVDCIKLEESGQGSKIPVCGIDQMLPMTTFYSPPKIKYNFATKRLNEPEESIYGGDFKVSQLSEFTERLLPVFRTLVNNTDDLEHFLGFRDLPNKVILFTEAMNTSTMLKAMTSYYRDRLDFAEIRRSRKKQNLCDRFGIKKYPTLMLLEDVEGEYKQIEYKGKKTLEDITKWLEPYAKKNRIMRPIDQYDGYPKVFKLEQSGFNESIIQNEKTLMVHVKKGKVEHQSWKEIITKFENGFRYYEVSIDTEDNEQWATDAFGINETPVILYYPPGITDKLKKGAIFYKNETLESTSNSIDKLINPQATELFDTSARHYFASLFFYSCINISKDALGSQNPTLIYLGTSSNTVADTDAFLQYKIVTHNLEYSRIMRFAYYIDAPKTILDGFSVQALPTIICIFPKNALGEQSLGSLRIEITAFNLKTFLDEIVAKYSDRIIPERVFSEINKHEVFQQKCQLGMEFCYIALLDASKRLYDIANPFSQLYKQLEMLDDYYEVVAKDGEQFSLSWVDGPCFKEILSSMNLKNENLPKIIAYNPNKDKYKMMKKEFTSENIKHFVKQSKTSKKFYKSLREFKDQGLDFDSKDCEQLHAEREMGGNKKQEEL